MLLNFDYDGVIVDSLDNLLGLTIKSQAFLNVGRRPSKNDFATLQDMTFEELARVIEIPAGRIPDFIEAVHRFEKEVQGTPEVYPGIVPVMNRLAQNHQIVVITASSSDLVKGILEKNGLMESVSGVMGGELGLSKAKRIAMAQAQFDHPSERTAMIGDAMSDIRQGKLAKVKTVAVTWGVQARELLAAESPDHLVDEPEALLTVFEN